jgi:sugar O-acyltransferase (sialic acid O-acetyltransferase NeuD family)
MKLYGIFGMGGFGREVLPVAEAMLKIQCRHSKYEIVFIDDKTVPGGIINGKKVISIDEFFSHHAKEKFFNIAIAQHSIRKKIAELMLERGAKPFRINAANYVELDNNTIADGAIFCPFTTVTSNAKIGKFFHANIYSYVAHDCVIGDYVTFSPNVHCNGNVIIEDYVTVGTGVVIREGTLQKPMIIGTGAVLGMGAVITKSVPAFEIVVGNPASPLRRTESNA